MEHSVESDSKTVIETILESCQQISMLLRNTTVHALESTNTFGDIQLHLDVECDHIVQKHLRLNNKVAAFLSEQRPVFNEIKNEGVIVTYDPLDGSSIIDTNFAIGSIFGIWKNLENKLINSKVGDVLLDAVLVTYGPRTTAIYYNTETSQVQQYILVKQKWLLSEKQIRIKDVAKIFAPGNLRAVTENLKYGQIVNNWIASGLTLRYTGGLVPDINHIFIKRNGIFSNISSKSHKAKLRLLYQVAPIAFLIERAGGLSVCQGHKSILQFTIKGYDDRLQCIFGSKKNVEQIQHLLV